MEPAKQGAKNCSRSAKDLIILSLSLSQTVAYGPYDCTVRLYGPTEIMMTVMTIMMLMIIMMLMMV